MAESELKVLCVKAVQRIHKIPFSDWGETDFLAEVLYEEFAPLLKAKDDEIATPKRDISEEGVAKWEATARNQCLRVGAGIKGSGEHDDRQAWRCPDCGLELQDVEASCCERCGSINPVEWR